MKTTGKALKEVSASSRPSRRGNLVISILLLAVIAIAIHEATQASREGRKVQALSERIQQLQKERDDALKSLADASAKRIPRLRARPAQEANQPVESLPSSTLYARLKDNQPMLTTEQVEAYLKSYGRKPSSLLAAYRTSGDPALLREAMQKYPNDPQVAFEAVFAKDISAAQRRQWLNAFEQSAPENPLANYLSAREYLKAGQTDLALQEFGAASGKHQFDDYTLSRRQDDEEAYLAAGYPTAEAKMVASSQVLLPQLAELKQLGVQMVDLAKSYRSAGDDASAQALLQMTTGLGQSYTAGDCGVSHLVGLAIQRIALGAMDQASTYDDSGHTVQWQLDQLTQKKAAITTLFRDNSSLLENMSDQDWISYIDRDKNFGEEAAMRWVVSKNEQK